MKTIRIAALLLMLSTLVAPFHYPANAADSGPVTVTEPAATTDPGNTPTTRAGVTAAILCGTGVGLFMDTKYIGFLAWGIVFCAFMAYDALITPDH